MILYLRLVNLNFLDTQNFKSVTVVFYFYLMVQKSCKIIFDLVGVSIALLQFQVYFP